MKITAIKTLVMNEYSIHFEGWCIGNVRARALDEAVLRGTKLLLTMELDRLLIEAAIKDLSSIPTEKDLSDDIDILRLVLKYRRWKPEQDLGMIENAIIEIEQRFIREQKQALDAAKGGGR